MKRLAAIALVLASCVAPSDPNIWTVLNTCLTDSGLTYAEISILSSGWYAITYPTAGGHWENGVWQPHPSQQTTWQYVYAGTTLGSVHGGGLQVWWSQVQQPGDDDPPYPVKGGIAPAATAHCAQSASTRGVQ
jgi:hypothetical protein